MKTDICEIRTPILGTLSMINFIESRFCKRYYYIFNNTAIIYIGILQY